MDRQALKFIEMLDDDAVDEHGDPKVSIELRFKLFDKGESWLSKRQKLRPQPDEGEGSGITDMRAWMENPGVQDMLDRLMFDKGYVKTPPKRTGRPPKHEEPMRSRYKEFQEAQQAEDDSGWQRMLREGQEE